MAIECNTANNNNNKSLFFTCTNKSGNFLHVQILVVIFFTCANRSGDFLHAQIVVMILDLGKDRTNINQYSCSALTLCFPMKAGESYIKTKDKDQKRKHDGGGAAIYLSITSWSNPTPH